MWSTSQLWSRGHQTNVHLVGGKERKKPSSRREISDNTPARTRLGLGLVKLKESDQLTGSVYLRDGSPSDRHAVTSGISPIESNWLPVMVRGTMV